LSLNQMKSFLSHEEVFFIDVTSSHAGGKL